MSKIDFPSDPYDGTIHIHPDANANIHYVWSETYSQWTVLNSRYLQFLELLTSEVTSTSYDFGSVFVPADGLLILGGVARNTDSSTTRAFSSILVDDVAATIHINPTGGENAAAIASIIAEPGYHNIKATFNESVLRCALGLWLLRNYNSATPIDTYGLNNNTTSFTDQLNLDAEKGGVVVIAHFHNTDAGTWDTAVEDATAALASGVMLISMAHVFPTPEDNTFQEAITWGGLRDSVIAAASWR